MNAAIANNNNIENINNNKLVNYTLLLADDALIMGHRLSEWTGHGPVLEQDIAISNIALDYVGQARNFYQYAAMLINELEKSDFKIAPATEDSLAYLRDVIDYKNHLLTELPNGDWGQSILKIFFFATYQYYLYQQLTQASDTQISAIAEKSLKEATYHLRWSSEWVIRLGDGTDESHERMDKAMDELWSFTGELCMQPINDMGFVNYHLLKDKWNKKIAEVMNEATLTIPENAWMQTGGTEGKHTEHLGFVLAEMQFLQRAYPGAEW